MAMLPQLYTINGIATETDRDRRAVAKMLADVPPDGQVGKSPAWRLRTFLSAAERDRRLSQAGTDELALNELERAANRTQQGLDTLRAEPSIECRRELVRSGLGAVIGELDRAFARAEAGRSAEARLVTRPFIDQVIGTAITELFELCRWRLGEEANSARLAQRNCKRV